MFRWRSLEKALSKLVITETEYKERKKIFCGLYDNRRFYQVQFSDAAENSQVGDIFVGRVKNIVKNINAAFVEYQKGCIGYFSLTDNRTVVFLNHKNTDKLCEGDFIIVQLEKAAVKTKFPVLTSHISISGRNLVLNVGKHGIGYSGRITDNIFKQEIHQRLTECMNVAMAQEQHCEELGLIVRTNAVNASTDNIVTEFRQLLKEWFDIKNTAGTRSCYSVLKKSDSVYLNYLKGSYGNEISEVITDNAVIYEEISAYLAGNQMEAGTFIRLYQDDLLPLSKLYSIDNMIEEILRKKVWLKSGAYLVIEPTEAMVVIDVNTGKNIKGKDTEKTILKVNKEAAEEIAYQLRIRNLSGIIMLDFINMERAESRKELMEHLKRCILADRVKTTVVDMTKLELVEVTRKKIEPPIYEQLM